jgi:hypothetical protein
LASNRYRLTGSQERRRCYDIHEIAGGKLTALLAPHAARDLFDTHQLVAQGELDRERMRLAFVAYGAKTIQSIGNYTRFRNFLFAQ